MRFSSLLIIQLALLVQSAHAWPPTFGTEFNFSSEKLDKRWQYRVKNFGAEEGNPPDHFEHDASQAMMEHVKRMCGKECVIEEHPGKFDTEYHVRFNDGFEFNISIDPAVVEVQTFPATAEQVRKQASRMERYIFGAAKKAGLTPVAPRGVDQELSAHFNIGVKSAFEDQPEAFARFYADYSSRPELGTGLLGEDPYNAPPVHHLDRGQQDALQEVIGKVNDHELSDVRSIAGAIHTRVHTSSPGFLEGNYWDILSDGQHYQGMGLKQVNTPAFPRQDRPLEIRAVRQPETAHEYALLSELMQKRIEYVRKQTGPIYFKPGKKVTHFSVERLAGQFFLYTREMGADWKRYLPLVSEGVRDELKRGKVQKVLGDGKVDWSKPGTEELVAGLLADQVAISEQARKRLKTILADEGTPPKVFDRLVKRVEKAGTGYPPHVEPVSDFLAGLSRSPRVLTRKGAEKTLRRATEAVLAVEVRKPEVYGGGCLIRRLKPYVEAGTY